MAARTWLVALSLVAMVTAGGAIAALVRYDLIGFGHLPRTAIIALLLLLTVNLLAGLRRKRPFSPRQILYVYIAVMVVSGLPGQQLVTYLYCPLLGPAHYNSPQNKYRETFFEYIPRWAVPSLDEDAPVVSWAFRGQPSGASLPWRPWVTPLAAWSSFYMLLFLNYLFLARLLRTQWIERERMRFPLAQIPIEMVSYDGRRLAPELLSRPLFWLAFAIPLVIHSVNALHYHLPFIPEIKLGPSLAGAFAGRPWSELNGITFNIYFDVIGISYLLSAEMGLSLWVFWLLKYGLRVGMVSFGRPNPEATLRDMGIGTYLLLGLLTLRNARPLLTEQGQAALRWLARALGATVEAAPSAAAESSAALSLWGFVVTLAALVWFGVGAGMTWWLAMLAFCLYFLSAIAVARLVAEAGLYAVWSPIWGPDSILVRSIGIDALRPRNITAMQFISHQIKDTASLTLAGVFQAERIAAGRLREMHVFSLMVASLALGVLASHPGALYAIYSRGVPALGWWPRATADGLSGQIAEYLRTPDVRLPPGAYGNMAAGAAVMLLLDMLHRRSLHWPLHPLGWAASLASITSERFGFSFSAGWLLARLALLAGGVAGYRAFQPFTLGLIVGNGFTLLAWTIIHYVRPISGALIIE